MLPTVSHCFLAVSLYSTKVSIMLLFPGNVPLWTAEQLDCHSRVHHGRACSPWKNKSGFVAFALLIFWKRSNTISVHSRSVILNHNSPGYIATLWIWSFKHGSMGPCDHGTWGILRTTVNTGDCEYCWFAEKSSDDMSKTISDGLRRKDWIRIRDMKRLQK